MKKTSYINLIVGVLLILLALSIVKDPTHLFIAFLIGIINIIYGMGWQNNITKYLNKKKDVR